jgi:hypothetical protein
VGNLGAPFQTSRKANVHRCYITGTRFYVFICYDFVTMYADYKTLPQPGRPCSDVGVLVSKPKKPWS